MIVGGTTSVDPDGVVLGETPYEQTFEILRKIEHELGRAGAALADVIQTRIYVTDISRAEEVGRAHGEFFGEIRPLMTMVEVARPDRSAHARRDRGRRADRRGLVARSPRRRVHSDLARAARERRVRDHGNDAAVAQLAEQRTFNPKVVGSIPTGGIDIALDIRGFRVVVDFRLARSTQR